MLPPKFKTVKQSRNSKVCVAASAAMVVGCTLRTARKHMKSSYCKVDGKPYYRTRELLKFVGSHGIVVGGDYSDPNGVCIDKHCVLVFDRSMADTPAILIVESVNFDTYTHTVFWDGQHVRDPCQCTPDTVKLDDYTVFEIWPLTYLDESQHG